MWRHIKPILQVLILANTMLVSSLYGSYWQTQQNVLLRFIYFTPQYQITTEWQEYQHTHLSTWNLKSFHEVNRKSKRFCCFSSIYTAAYKKKTKGRGKIVHILVRTALYKPSIDNVIDSEAKFEISSDQHA